MKQNLLNVITVDILHTGLMMQFAFKDKVIVKIMTVAALFHYH